MPKPLFKKGRKKTGGRTKGVQNKSSLLSIDYIQKVLDGFPPESFIRDLRKIKDPARRAMLLLELMEFILPKKSRVQHVAADEEGNEQTFLIGTQVISFK